MAQAKLQACSFCTAQAFILCDWRMEDKPARKASVTAQVGDIWITQKKHLRALILEIENLDGRHQPTNGTFYVRRFWVKIPGHPEPYPYVRVNGDSFDSLQSGVCGALVCDLHAREAAEDRHYCAAHWDSWRSAQESG